MAIKSDSPSWNKILWGVFIVCIIIGTNMGSWLWGGLVGIGIVVYLQSKYGEDAVANNTAKAAQQNNNPFSKPYSNIWTEEKQKELNDEGLVALMFIARADGKFTDTEKQVIRKYLQNGDREGYTETSLKALYKMNPSRERFKQALHSLSRYTDNEKKMFYDVVIEMSDYNNKRNGVTENAIKLALKELGLEH